jgi:alkylated DNA nucleotide flippase Atl1
VSGRASTEEERELYAELVLQCAESVPRGHVTTYGAIADVVGQRLVLGGPRLVG